MAIITLAEAKTHLNIPTDVTTDDTELTVFVSVASDLVEGYADRKFTSTTGTQVFDGGGTTFVLSTYPISTVSSVSLDGTAMSSSAYEVDLAHGVVTTYSPTYAAPQYVSITYTVADQTLNLAKHATKETVRHLWETQRGTGRGRNPRGGDDYTAGASFSLPRRVMELLDPIRSL